MHTTSLQTHPGRQPRSLSNKAVACYQSFMGFSLVEMMVALVIGLVVSLSIYGVLAANEGRKRTSTSVNDINQSGTFTIFQMDKYIRSSGSGFSAGIGNTAALNYTYGCAMRVARGGAQLLPAGSFPAPFAAVNTTVRMAPVVIMDNAAPNGDDILISMAGQGGIAEFGTELTSNPSATQLNVRNQIAFRPSELVLLAGTGMPCMVEQVDGAFVPTVGATAIPMGGTYYQANIAGSDVTAYGSVATTALNLGSRPSFNAFAIGTNNTLMRYDLLLPASTDVNTPNPSVLSEGVYAMHAAYLVRPCGAGSVSTWTAPTGAFSAATLLNGSAGSIASLRTITAIRLGIVMQAALPEKENVSPATVTLFPDLAPALRVNVNLVPQNVRYKVLETTIPIRNNAFC